MDTSGAQETRPAEAASGDALLERERELKLLEQAVAAAIAGRGGAVALLAEAGLGKTSLLGAAARLAAERGLRVLRARGDPLEEDIAWGGAIQLFAGVALEPHADSLFTGAAGLARPLLDRGSPGRSAGTAAFPLLHGLHWLTANLSERQPLLLAVDDVHWLDAETLRFLDYLLGRVETLRVAVVCTERLGEPAVGMAPELLARLRASDRMTAARLSPLSAGSVRGLVRDRLPEAGDALCEAVAEATAGNPFLVTELIGAARREAAAGAPPSAAALREIRPESVRSSISLRLGRLGGDAVDLAAAVAILGPAASQRLAARLAGVPAGRAAAAIDALVEAGILTAERDRLTFVHPIIRDVVYGDAPPSRRAREHLEAARLLRSSGTSAAAVAAQLLAGGPAREAWALAALREAAALAASRGAPATAARLLRRALDEAVAAGQRRELLFRLGQAEAATREDRAASRFAAALEVPGEEPPAPRIAAALGEALYDRGEYADAASAFERGLALLRDGRGSEDPVLEAQLLGGLGSACELAGTRSPLVERRIEEALSRSSPQPSAAERILLALATGVLCLRGTSPCERVVELGHRALAGEDLPAVLGRPVLEPVSAGLGVADDETALRLLDAAVTRARQRGERSASIGPLALRALYRWRFGRLLPALADAEDVVRIAAESPDEEPYLAVASLALAVGSLDRGDLAAAERACRVPGAPQRWDGIFVLPAYFRTAIARVALARGRSAAALAALEDAGELFRRVAPNPAICEWRSDAALAAARVGKREAGTALADEELELSRRFGARRAIGVALRGRALIERPGEAAVEMMREAVAVLGASPAGLEHARALVDLGSTLRRGGWARDARRPLREGIERARGLGAAGLAERGAEELIASGARPRPIAPGGVESLTPSELRVAQMAASGMSNREVAEALFVTRRTVETHLTHTYAKLGISSRKELPAALGGAGDAG